MMQWVRPKRTLLVCVDHGIGKRMSGGYVSISQLQQSRFAMSMFPLSTTLHSSVGSRAAALADDKNAKHIAQDAIRLKWGHHDRERTGGGGGVWEGAWGIVDIQKSQNIRPKPFSQVLSPANLCRS